MRACVKKEAVNVKDDLVSALTVIDGVNFLAVELNLDAKSVKDLAFQLKSENAPFLGVFAIKNGEKANISVAISDDVIADKGLKAGDLVKGLLRVFVVVVVVNQCLLLLGSFPEYKEALSKAEGFLK